MKRNINLMALAAAAVLVFACSCSQQKGEPEAQEETVAATVEVETSLVQQGAIRQVVELSGALAALPDRDVKVSALVAGRIDELRMVEGDPVSRGQSIAKLDDVTLRDQVHQAKAALENAQANEERMSRLFERGIAAGKEKEDAHRDFVAAQTGYDTALTQLARTEVHSPISGIVVKRFKSVGEQVDGTGADPIVEVANFDPIELRAGLPTSYLAFVRQGQLAEVSTDAFRGQVFQGSIVSVLPAVDPATGSGTVRIQIANHESQLKGGMFATAGVIADQHPEALYVPAAALLITNDEPKVFVVGADSKAQERKVKPGWRDGDKVEILEGVRKGEVVVTIGSYGLADGMKVIIKKPS